eukprot:838980-Prymnesium_polylepis.1
MRAEAPARVAKVAAAGGRAEAATRAETPARVAGAVAAGEASATHCTPGRHPRDLPHACDLDQPVAQPRDSHRASEQAVLSLQIPSR